MKRVRGSELPEVGYTIVVRATDDQGEFAEDSVNLFVETYPDYPPTASILDWNSPIRVDHQAQSPYHSRTEGR